MPIISSTPSTPAASPPNFPASRSAKTEVGPTIGADNLNRGLIACGFGLVVVAVFLIGYYYVAGLVAFIAVCINIMLILAVMAALSATFTLPSIAGIVLTVGTAVDANVLIFERLREEQHRGLPLRMALRNSYDTARSAIIDSNMTSIITSVCLYMFGSEEVKGFGLTLIIGIVASLFTALYVTKTVFALLIDRFGVTHLGSFPLTFPKWDGLLKPNWDWMGKAWIFYTFSIIMITIGMILFVVKVRQGQMMDIEFASGTSVQFELTHPMAQDDVRKLIDQASDEHPKELPSPSVVAVGTDQLHYQVVTPNIDRTAVKSAVLQAMGSDLKLQLASQFRRFAVRSPCRARKNRPAHSRQRILRQRLHPARRGGSRRRRRPGPGPSFAPLVARPDSRPPRSHPPQFRRRRRQRRRSQLRSPGPHARG